jgi:Tol biopolymer transport system component
MIFVMKRPLVLAALSLTVVLPSAAAGATPTMTDPPLAFMVPDNDIHSDLSAIYAVNTDGTHLRRLTGPYAEAEGPAWSPGGQRLAYADFLRLYVIDRNGRHRRLVVKEDDGIPRWSPTGRQLVYVGAGGAKALTIVNVATRRSRTLNTDPVYPSVVDWSPDGRTLAFVGDESEDAFLNSDIYVIGSNGSGLRKLIEGGRSVDLDEPRWSPDGKRLLYTWHRHGTTFLYAARADGSRRKRLIQTGADAEGSWSWDGNRIAFGVTGIRLLDLRSGKVRKIDLRICRRYSCQQLDWSRRR